MAFTLPNIYNSKNVKYYAIVPLVLMLIGIYLSSGIVLDPSLSGGVSIILQSNTTMNAQQVAGLVGGKLGISNPGVVVSKGQVSLTLPKNKALTEAERYELAVYTYQRNYSSFLINQTNAKQSLLNNPANKTSLAALALANKGLNNSLQGIRSSLNNELAVLKPYIGSINYNGSDVSQITNLAANAYQNASVAYTNNTVASLRQVLPFSSYSYQLVTQIQSNYLISKLFSVIEIAFILIIIVVFVIFRSPIPSFAVVFGAANDMIIAIGAMALFKIPLGIASIGGLLMLLGYSIDTDVLTAIRILKRREGTPEDRAYSAMNTGLTMTVTAIVSFAVLFAVSFIYYVPTYYEISGVALFGLIGDIATTWLGNAPMILLYLKSKKRV